MEIYRKMSFPNIGGFQRVNSIMKESGMMEPAPEEVEHPLKRKNFKEALEEYLRIDSFCMCAESGRDKDIKCMEDILEKDPKK
jgi:hypothetical protein